MLSGDETMARYVIAGRTYTMSERTLDDEQRLCNCDLSKLALEPAEGDPFQLRVWLDEGLLRDLLSIVLRDEQGQRYHFTDAEILQITASTRNALVHDFFFLNSDLPDFLLTLASAIPTRSGAAMTAGGAAVNISSISAPSPAAAI